MAGLVLSSSEVAFMALTLGLNRDKFS
jgi:hypothetical protein